MQRPLLYLLRAVALHNLYLSVDHDAKLLRLQEIFELPDSAIFIVVFGLFNK